MFCFQNSDHQQKKFDTMEEGGPFLGLWSEEIYQYLYESYQLLASREAGAVAVDVNFA